MLERVLFLTLWKTTRRDYCQRSRLIWSYRGDGFYRLTPMGLFNTALRPLGLQMSMEVP